MSIIGDPQGTSARAADVERRYPATSHEEPPASFERRRVIALAALIGVPALIYLVLHMLGII